MTTNLGERVPESQLTLVAQRPGLAMIAAFVRRDWLITISYKLPFVMEVVQSVTALTMFWMISRLVNRPGSSAIPGVGDDYFSFLLLGTSTLSLLTVGMTAFAERLRADQTTGTLETLLTMPVPTWFSVLAGTSYQFLYAIAVVSLNLALGLVFGLSLHVNAIGVVVAIICLIGAIALFASIGVAVAAFVVVFKRGTSIVGLLTTILGFLGGVYYPVEMMPGWLAQIAQVLPFTWAVDVIRDVLLHGTYPLGKIAGLYAAAAIFLPVSCMLLNRSVNRARRSGTLGQF